MMINISYLKTFSIKCVADFTQILQFLDDFF